MGEKNDVMCEYLGKPEVFADFLNGGLFQGRQVIHAGEVRKEERNYNTKLNGYHGRKVRMERERDVLKRILHDKKYIIVGMENQEKVHEFMPLRCMEYDVLEYSRQMREQVWENRREGKLSSAEYLSGVKKGAKLCPVVTIVFYHGKDDYDGCKSLYDMLDYNGNECFWGEYVSDYRMNLITVKDLEEERFQTGLRELIAMMKRSEDKKALREYCEENRERLSLLDEETYDTIGVMINQRNLSEYKASYKEEGGYDMCRAIDEMIEDGRAEGRAEGLAEGLESAFRVLSELVSDGLLKLEEAASRMGISEAAFAKKMQEMGQ